MMFQSLSFKKKIVTALIIGAQFFVPLLAPINVAFADTAFANAGAPGGTVSSSANVPSSTLTDIVKAPLNWASSLVSKAASATVGGVADATLGNALKFVAWLFFEAAGKFLQVMAYILDMSIDKTIDSGMYKNLNAINVGWTAIRDITNMFFIFVLLYISILTILGISSSNAKRWVAHLIIAALLINFSLFMTQVVVDAGNMLTVGFWSNIKTTNGSGTNTGGFAPVVMEALKLQTIFNGGEGDNVTKAKIYFGGAIVMFIAGYVLLAGAIMMIVRTVTLIILMIASPFAFLGFALPKGGGFAHKWLDSLLGSTFVAPVFVMMLYINMIIIRSLDIQALGGAGGSQFAAVMAGDVNNFAIVYNFLVVIILLLASLYVAKSVSSDIGGKAGGYAKTALGYGGGLGIAGVGIAGSRVGRQIGGSTGRMVQNSKKVDEWAKSKNWMVRNIATTAKRTGGAMAKGTWDVRNTGTISTLNKGLGLANTGVKVQGPLLDGSKKSFETHGGLVGSTLTAGVAGVGAGVAAANRTIRGEAQPEKTAAPSSPFIFRGTENEKKIIEKAKEVHAYNPEAREMFMKDRGVDLNAPRNKAVNNDLKRDLAKNESKKILDDKKKEQEALEKKIASNTISPEAAAKEGEVIAKAVKEAMTKLTTTEKAELAPMHKDNIHFINNLDKSDYSMIHKAEMEGKTNGSLKEITEKVMKSNNNKLQSYILNPENQNRLTMIDQEAIKEDSSLMANYEKRMKEVELQKSRIKDVNKAHEEALKEQQDRSLLGSLGNV